MFGSRIITCLMSWIKNEQPNPTAFIRVMGWEIEDIIPVVQVFEAAVIGTFRTYFCYGHNFFPVYIVNGRKAADIPQLEESHIKADMGRIEPRIPREFFKHSIEVFYIIHAAKICDESCFP